MFDTTRSYYSDSKERAVAPGATFTAEAQFLIYVSDGAGGVAVQASAGGAAERPAGWLLSDALRISTEVIVEEVVVPAVAPYTVNLKNTNIVSGSERVVNIGTGVALAENCPVPGAAQYCLVDATGLVTFNAAQAGVSMRITYRYNMTLEQILNKYHERSINNRWQDYFGTCSVMSGEGEMFTDQYDTTQAYAVGDIIYTGAGGRVTSAAGGVQVGMVTQVPGVNDTFFGVKFNLPFG